ncbi:hypothetical protein GJAV_G00048520 [Gymnothorax javanicus]|nr:hypothetical protein GJAV_G00048520 [Gymnothorax javanicus]
MIIFCLGVLFIAIRTEAFTVLGPAMPLVVRPGRSVTLPCSADTPLPTLDLEVRWMRVDSGSIVHMFPEGGSRPESQSPSYRGRAEFFSEEISKGNFSLLFMNVTSQDKGLYKCVVLSDQESHQTTVKINIERLTVTGAVEPVFAYAGESRPESQDARFRGRAEFFSEEIPKGNFSMKLRDIKTEDRGEFMCRVDTDSESVNATAWLQEQGLSTLNLCVLGLTFAAAVIAVLSCIPAICRMIREIKKKESKTAWQALRRTCGTNGKWNGIGWLCFLQVSVPCILLSIAFVIWGIIESSVGEAYVCSVVNLVRILVVFKVAPYELPGKYFEKFTERALHFEIFFLTTGINSVLLQNSGAAVETKVLIGIFFGLVLLYGLLGVRRSNLYSAYFFGARSQNIMDFEIFFLIFTRSSFGFGAVFMVWFILPALDSALHSLRIEFFSQQYLWQKLFEVLQFILESAIYLLLLHFISDQDKEHPGIMCFTAFLYIMKAIMRFNHRSDLPAVPHILAYVFGSAGLSVLNSVALATEVFLKAEKGQRTVEDLRVVILLIESLFLACWLCLQTYAFCDAAKNKSNVKHQINIISLQMKCNSILVKSNGLQMKCNSILVKSNGFHLKRKRNWETFKLKVLQSTRDVLGRPTPTPKQPWITQPTLDVIAQRREARLRGDMTEYRQLNAVRNKAISANRERFWKEEAERLESAAHSNNLRLVYNTLHQAHAGPRIRTTLVKDAQGNPISSEADCLDRWREHCSLLLHHPPTPTDPNLVTSANLATPNSDCRTDPVTAHEVRSALKKLINKKAPGFCAITAEMLKEGGDCMIQWLTHIINHVGITLLSIPAKLFTRILLTRALPAIRSHRHPQQAGFMPNRSTTDHISVLRLIIENVRKFRKNQHLFIAFIDLKAAFDTVDHASLWNILKYLGVPPKITTMFQRLYINFESCVRVSGKDSGWFPIDSGVRQGCVAAPDLFNCVVDHLMTQVCKEVSGVWLGNYHLTDLEYADNTTLFSSSLQDLSSALTIYTSEATKLGLQVSWQKTKLMYVGDGPDPPPLYVGSDAVEFVSSFTYLGSTITDKGDLKPEIDSRRALQLPPCSLSGGPSGDTALSRGLMALTAGLSGQSRTSNGITNTIIWEHTHQPPASRLAARRHIRWYGHVLRLPPEHLTRAVLSFNPTTAGWKRPCCRPHTRWLDIIKEDLHHLGINMEAAEDLAEDHPYWRNLVKLISSTHSDVPVEEDQAFAMQEL